MATYRRQYPYMPEKRKKQKYSMLTRVIDFTNNLPVTSGERGRDGSGTTAWAANDVLQAIQIRAGQTVLGVQVEIITKSADSLDFIEIGYGDDSDRWGKLNLSAEAGVKGNLNRAASGNRNKVSEGYYPQIDGLLGGPHYFASSDTIDVKILRAAIQGKIRLIVHVLEDDR